MLIFLLLAKGHRKGLLSLAGRSRTDSSELLERWQHFPLESLHKMISVPISCTMFLYLV